MDLGGFQQYIHHREVSRRVEWAGELDVGTLRGQSSRILQRHKTVKVSLSFGMPLDDLGKPVANERPWLISYELEASSGVIVRLSRRPDGTMHLDRLEAETIQPLIDALMINTTAEKVDEGNDLAALLKEVNELIPTLRFTANGLLPDKLLGEEYALTAPLQLIPIPKGDRLQHLVGSTKLFIPRAIAEIILGVNGALRAQLARVKYLGPLRSFPPRHLAFSDDRGRNWLAGGGYAWDVVRTNDKVRSAVNRWLGSEALQTRYQLKIRTLSPLDALENPLGDAIEGLPIEVVAEGEQPGTDSAGHEYDGEPPQYGIKDPQAEAERILKELQANVGEKYDELVLMDLRSNTAVTHRDVGIGVSQVLPVLVHAYADEGKVVAIEQPEIHLHPALQAELGDLFIESALGERQNTFLLETHSEHLILRILHRVRQTTEKSLPEGMTPIRPEDITVIFIEPTSKGSVVRHMPVTPDGDFGTPWPGGFFAERLADLP